MLNDDIYSHIVTGLSNLDDIIQLSLTNEYFNNYLTNNIQMIADHLNITRPVISWQDLIRENSKIHGTRYAKIKSNLLGISDLVTRFLLLENVIRDDRLDLIFDYLDILSPDNLIECQSEEMIKFLLSKLSTPVKRSKHNVSHETISLTCQTNGHFNPTLFKLWYEDILPSINSNFHYKGLNYVIDVNDGVKSAIDDDYPLNHILKLDKVYHHGDFWLHSNRSSGILLENIGIVNLHLLTPPPEKLTICKNTKIVADYFKSNNYRPFVSFDYIEGMGDEIVRYMFDYLEYPVTESILKRVVELSHFPAINYFKDKHPEILTYKILIGWLPINNYVINWITRIYTIDQVKDMLQEIVIFKGDIIGGCNDSPQLIKRITDMGIILDDYTNLISSAIKWDNMRTTAYIMKISGINNPLDKFLMSDDTKHRMLSRLEYYSTKV